MNDNQVGNSNDGNQSKEDAVFDSSDFFDNLEDSVNGIVKEEGETPSNTTQVTQSASGSEQVTHNTSQGSNVDWDNENNPYKKRYKDSSREAIKMAGEMKDLKPFVPVLEAMKRDSVLLITYEII